MDGLHLLAQVVLALALRDLVLDIGLDLGAQLEHFHFPRQHPVQALQSPLEFQALQQFLPLGGGEGREIGGDEVRQAPGVFDVHHDRLEIVRERGRELHHLLEHRHHAACQSLEIRSLFGGEEILKRLHPRPEVRLLLEDFLHRDPLESLHKDKQALVGQLDDLVDVGRRTDLVEIDGLRIIHARVALGDNRDEPFIFFEVVDQL